MSRVCDGTCQSPLVFGHGLGCPLGPPPSWRNTILGPTLRPVARRPTDTIWRAVATWNRDPSAPTVSATEGTTPCRS